MIQLAEKLFRLIFSVFFEAHYTEEHISVQNGVSIHHGKVTSNRLQEDNVKVFSWFACLPNLNCIENLWGILARKAYSHGRHFETKQELMNEIQKQ